MGLSLHKITNLTNMKKLFLAMALCVASLAYAAEPVFYDARQYEITGTVVKDAENPWNRLPVELKDTVSKTSE